MKNTSKKSKKNEPICRSPKEERLFQNLLKITEQFMGGKGFKSLTESELMQRLSLPIQHTDVFKAVLSQLISQGLLEYNDMKYQWKKSSQDVVKGILKMNPRGFGFVQVEQPSPITEDIFIPKPFTKNGVDGDYVEVLINQEVISDKGPEGRIVAILSRSRTHMAGIIKEIDRHGDSLAFVPLLGSQQRVVVTSSEERVLNIGDRIVMEVVDWGSKETETVCRMSHYLGHISDPSCDIACAIEEFEIRTDFANAVLEEAKQYGTKVSTHDIGDREDLRSLTTFTIDPDTAKDFDDALSLTKDASGVYHLGVHIADVSHYVKPGSALDKEASERCNSTYFPGTCVPMLPGVLSENLCSLKPNVNRLTVSVLVKIDSQGEVLDYQIVRSVIKSCKRFTYKDAKKVLDGKKASPHKPTLELMVELCGLLKKKRYQRGSIEFAIPELVVKVDDNGVPYGTDYITYDITHQLVEEFMLKANELVALHLSNQGKNLTYRIHDVPAEENLRDFAILATAFGFKISDNPSPQDLQKLFEDAGDTPYSTYLASCYIRRMRMAAYSAENIGHYGLSLTHYCHFTSPIRRYVDLVVHRILFGHEDELIYLQNISTHSSEQERISAKAENSVLILKKLRLLQTMYQADPYREYDAIITRVKNFGIYFEVMELLIEGFVHISDLEEDYFVYEEKDMRLRGVHQGSVYAPGARIKVVLKQIDLIVQQSNWYVISKESSEAPSKTKNARAKNSPSMKRNDSSHAKKTTKKKWRK